MAALLALLSAVGWGGSDYAAGIASRRSSALSVVVLTHLVALGVLLVCGLDLVAPAVTSLSLDGFPRLGLSWATPGLRGSPTAVDLAWGAAAGLAGGLGALLLYRGLARGAMAVVAPITAATAAAVPAVWGLAGGEPVTPVSAVALSMGLASIVLVSAGAAGPDAGVAAVVALPPAPDDLPGRIAWLEAEVAELRAQLTARRSRLGRRRARLRPGVADALGSGLGFGAFYVLLDRTTAASGVWSLVAARGASVAMFATVALITVGAASVLPARGARWTVGVAGVLDAVAAVSYLGATHTGYLSVVAVLSSLYPGVTVLLARTLAQERLVRRQLAGLGCAGVAVALFALG